MNFIMALRKILILVAAVAAIVAAAPGVSHADDRQMPEALAGQALFLRRCAGCHGAEGAGDGADAGWLLSPPRDLRSGFLDRYATPELIDRVVLGARLQLEIDPEAMRRRSGDTESLVEYLQRLGSVDWGTVDRGADIYLHRCESCHGPYGAPPSHVPQGVGHVRDLGSAAFQSGISDSELLVAVRHGHHGMPALVPQVEAREALDLVSFVRHLSPGFTLYEQTCAACHGDRGHGVGSFAETERLPTVRFDEAYFARVDRDDLRLKVWHMLDEHQPRMPHFEERLSPDEARRIVLYLQSRASLPTPAAAAEATATPPATSP